jgi:hypothetical protein
MEVLDRRRVWVALVLLAMLCGRVHGVQTPSQKRPPVNQDSLVIASFENNIKEYVKLHNKAKAGIPPLKPTDSADAINHEQRLLAGRIRDARPEATQGAIFTPEISLMFKRLIGSTMQGPDAAKIRASLRRAEPLPEIKLRVNAEYPERLPLQSSPPSVLVNLPQLPPELDYRIVGRDLVLRDVGANLVVDFIPNAIPSS